MMLFRFRGSVTGAFVRPSSTSFRIGQLSIQTLHMLHGLCLAPHFIESDALVNGPIVFEN